MTNIFCALFLLASLLTSPRVCVETAQASAGDKKTRAAIDRTVRRIGYEVSDRKFGSDETIFPFETRDAESYKPATRACFKLRSLRPARHSTDTYYRYWLFRETYDSEEHAEKRAREYERGYTERLATEQMSSFMISKMVIRVDAARRDTTVYMLVTDGAYTLFDDTNRDKILSSILKTKDT